MIPTPLPADVAAFRRPPEQVMRLARLGSAHPTRLSFLRVLLRRMQAEHCPTRDGSAAKCARRSVIPSARQAANNAFSAL